VRITVKRSALTLVMGLVAGARYGLGEESGAQTVDPDSFALESLFTMEVTTASKFPQKLSDAPGVMSVVTRDELRRFGAQTVGEALERVPGLAASSGYFTDRLMVGVRGDYVKENGSHVLILLNGRPTREVMEGGVISDVLRSFPVNALERIEVIRGPGSVLYGTNAFSGVINLITRKAHGREVGVRAHGTAGGSGGSAEVLWEDGDWSVIAAGQTRMDPTRSVPFTSIEFGPGGQTDSRTEQVSIPDRGTGAYLGIDYKKLRFMGAYTDMASESFTLVGAAHTRGQRGFMNLGYSLSPTERWEMSIDVTHTLTRLGLSHFPWVDRASSDTVVEWTNFVRVSSRNNVTLGALHDYVEGTEWFSMVRPGTVVSQGSRHANSFYAQWEHRVSDSVQLIGGVQSNKIAGLATSTVPRAGVVWSPRKHWHVKALYGKAFRAPSLNELNLRHTSLRGNPHLAAEFVRTTDVSVSYQSDRFLASVSAFDSRQSGIIAATLAYDIEALQYRNLGAVRISGLEGEAKQYLTDRLFWSGSMMYMANQDEVQGIFSGQAAPRWLAATGLSYQDRRWCTVGVQSVLRPPIRAPVQINPASESYVRLNAHGRFELSRVFGDGARGLALYVHGVNMANQKVWVPVGGSGLGIPFQMGRTVYYGLEVSLSRD